MIGVSLRQARELGGNQMGKIMAMDAENRAREFIGNRHPRVKIIRFTRTWREADVWLVKGRVWLVLNIATPARAWCTKEITKK